MMYNREIIKERFNSGETLSFVPFWGHTAKPGWITKSCFSQWYDCLFEVDGVIYHTTEQFMMAQKALLFGDQEFYEKIMQANQPREYKALGRRIRNFDGKIWDGKKYEIVLQGNLAKFAQNPELLEFLLRTGDSILIEASPYDGIWGVQLAAEDARIQNPNEWKGENLLGFALMETRERLRAGN